MHTLESALDPFVRRVVSLWSLPAGSPQSAAELRGATIPVAPSTSFGLAMFRTRAILDRFTKLMTGKRIMPWCSKTLRFGLTRQRTLTELRGVLARELPLRGGDFEFQVPGSQLFLLNEPLEVIETRISRGYFSDLARAHNIGGG